MRRARARGPRRCAASEPPTSSTCPRSTSSSSSLQVPLPGSSALPASTPQPPPGGAPSASPPGASAPPPRTLVRRRRRPLGPSAISSTPVWSRSPRRSQPPPAPPCGRVPFPYPEESFREPPRARATPKGIACRAVRLMINLMVSVSSWLHLGRPTDAPASCRRGTHLNARQDAMVERFTAILEPFARLTSATAEDLGRMAPKADAASELLQRLAPLTNACMLLRRAAELSVAFESMICTANLLKNFSPGWQSARR